MVDTATALDTELRCLAGAVYFELDRGSPHWAHMQNSGGFAIHVSGDFPNLRMELWAILA
jgi:type VI secretion system protein ImpJ